MNDDLQELRAAYRRATEARKESEDRVRTLERLLEEERQAYDAACGKYGAARHALWLRFAETELGGGP